MRHFPLFLDLVGRLVVVIGGGVVAERKVEVVLGCGAVVRLVAPVVTPALRAHAQFARAAPTVAARISDLLSSNCLASTAAIPTPTAIPTPSTDSTGPPGSRNSVIRPGDGRKSLAGSSELIRHWIEWPRTAISS